MSIRALNMFFSILFELFTEEKLFSDSSYLHVAICLVSFTSALCAELFRRRVLIAQIYACFSVNTERR